MCYKVFTHTMACDKRPLISSGKTTYVTPYDAPIPCCSQHPQHTNTTTASERCAWHGCCRLKTLLYHCRRRKPCAKPTLYHQYAQLVSHDSYAAAATRSRRWHSYPPSPTSRSRSYSFSHAPWPAMYVLDGGADFHAAETAGFRRALDGLAHTGHLLRHADGERGKARLRLERERRRHREAHGAGCGCDWTGAAEHEADNAEVVVERLAFCWNENVAVLRAYEEMGDRRVHGIVEDVGVSRESYADKYGRPVVYARRESRIKVEEEPAKERRRHRDGERRHSTRTTYAVKEKRPSREEPIFVDCGRSWWRMR